VNGPCPFAIGEIVQSNAKHNAGQGAWVFRIEKIYHLHYGDACDVTIIKHPAKVYMPSSIIQTRVEIFDCYERVQNGVDILMETL
jgi:hypothetical protein